MSGPFTVPPAERGMVRVFSLAADDDTARALQRGDMLLAPLLGLDRIDREHVEVFPVSDLAGITFSDYLIDGQGVAPQALQRDRATLDALDGYVVIVLSGAFRGDAVELAPTPELTFVAAFSEDRPDFAPEPIPAQSALPYSAPSAQPAPAPMNRAARTGSAALLVVLIALGLFLWLVLA